MRYVTGMSSRRFSPYRELGRTGFVATRIGAGDLADASLPFETCVSTLTRALVSGDVGIKLGIEGTCGLPARKQQERASIFQDPRMKVFISNIQHGKPRQEIARGGVYHITFERDTPIQLVRIALPAGSGLYPETSGSHYRCSVRLLAWNGLNTRPQQTTEDVPFTLTCCS